MRAVLVALSAASCSHYGRVFLLEFVPELRIASLLNTRIYWHFEQTFHVLAIDEASWIILKFIFNCLYAFQWRESLLLRASGASRGTSCFLYLTRFLHKLLQYIVFQNGVVEEFEVLKVLDRVLLPCRINRGWQEASCVPCLLKMYTVVTLTRSTSDLPEPVRSRTALIQLR